MLPGLEMMACPELAVPMEVMQHVVNVESSFNPYAIGVVGGRLARQPQNLAEAVSTSRMLEREGYNFSLGIAQVNRHNLARQGLDSYEKAFKVCPNLQAGSRILAECYARSGRDWGKAFSCYYSGNFTTGFRHGYVDKVMTSWRGAGSRGVASNSGIPVVRNGAPATTTVRRAVRSNAAALLAHRLEEAALTRALGSRIEPMQADTPLVQGALPAQQPPAQGMPPAQLPVPDPRLQAAAAPPAADVPVQVHFVGAGPNTWGAGAQPVAQPAQSSTAAPMAAPPANVAPPRDAALVF